MSVFSKTFKISLVLAGIIALGAQTATASSAPKLIGTYDNWNVFTFTDDAGKKVCFMSARPASAKGNYTRRGDIYAYITHWPSKGHKNMINFDTGYAFKPNSMVDVSIGNQKFQLATEGEKAWAYNQADDDEITSAIRKGSTMTVKGTSSRGTVTTDTYSLKGTGDAYEAISKACGM